jgi:sugar/nucleoside kinase (ribokinase family)
MSLVVVGSIALDTLETPAGKRSAILGGSAVYFSMAARLFGPVSLVGVVGRDFPQDHVALLESHGIGTEGLTVQPGETFRWTGRYVGDMGAAETLDVQLNVFGDFRPELPESYRDAEYVFLANGSPHTQRSVREQARDPKLVFLDTMNLWIDTEREALDALVRDVGGIVLNLDEAKQMTGLHSAVSAARGVAALGADKVIMKKGEHGALVLAEGRMCALPAFPTDKVVDPTGAGDSFAGGMMGCLASTGDLSFAGLRRAAAYGTVTASLTVEGFGVEALARADRGQLDARLAKLRELTEF